MTIDLPIGQDRHSKNKMCISKTGKDALTHFKEIKTKGNYTLVKCQIETGRKHQNKSSFESFTSSYYRRYSLWKNFFYD